MLPRDRAIMELLYASGLRVSELVGLNDEDMDRAQQMLRVRGKGRKERIVPFGGKAQTAMDNYWNLRAELLAKGKSKLYARHFSELCRPAPYRSQRSANRQ